MGLRYNVRIMLTHGTDIREFGAVGDASTLDTAAIQQAIDACGARGGGLVLLQGGTFFTGSLRLRSHVSLHVSAGAVLLGSPNLADYQEDKAQQYAPGIIGKVLVYAEGCVNVGISGAGMIHGNGDRFPKSMATPISPR